MTPPTESQIKSAEEYAKGHGQYINWALCREAHLAGQALMAERCEKLVEALKKVWNACGSDKSDLDSLYAAQGFNTASWQANAVIECTIIAVEALREFSGGKE